jgi:CBS domain-containing protein
MDKIVKEILSREVETIAPDASIQDAARKMETKGIGMLPVCDGDRIVGTITDRDITIRGVAAGKDPRSTRVKELMTEKDLIYATEDESVATVAERMRGRQVRRVPVVTTEKRLIGVVSTADLSLHLTDEKLGQVLEGISRP